MICFSLVSPDRNGKAPESNGGRSNSNLNPGFLQTDFENTGITRYAASEIDIQFESGETGKNPSEYGDGAIGIPTKRTFLPD